MHLCYILKQLNSWLLQSSRKLILNIFLYNAYIAFVVSCRRKTTVKTLCIYADYKSDESYTPSKISVRVGNNFHNLQEIRVSQ